MPALSYATKPEELPSPNTKNTRLAQITSVAGGVTAR